MTELPIVCTRREFDPGEAERQQRLVRELRESVEEIRELPEGFAFRFPAEFLSRAAELMAIEKRCCGFLNLRLETTAAEPYVWLTLQGPPGTKAVLREELPLFS